MYTSEICSTGTLDFSRADLMATAPSLEAGTAANEPLNYENGQQRKRQNQQERLTFAVGVLAALRM